RRGVRRTRAKSEWRSDVCSADREVTGTAMMEVVPDEIYVKIILREKDQRGKTELEQQEKKLFQTLQKVGIDVKKDLAVRNMAGRSEERRVGKARKGG